MDCIGSGNVVVVGNAECTGVVDVGGGNVVDGGLVVGNMRDGNGIDVNSVLGVRKWNGGGNIWIDAGIVLGCDVVRMIVWIGVVDVGDV